jgi:hypothetical protein
LISTAYVRPTTRLFRVSDRRSTSIAAAFCMMAGAPVMS